MVTSPAEADIRSLRTASSSRPILRQRAQHYAAVLERSGESLIGMALSRFSLLAHQLATSLRRRLTSFTQKPGCQRL
ncbi:DUF6118 family protein [Aliihoeflea sp. PC F10.4]